MATPSPPPTTYRLQHAGDIYLGVVQYLLQQHPEYLHDSELLNWAAEAGCEAMVEWLVEQPGSLDAVVGATLYVAAAKNGDRATLATLRRLGVPWGAQDVVVRAVREKCGVPGLRWLVEQGAPVGSRSAMVAAIKQTPWPWCRSLSAEEVACLQGLAEEDQAAAAAPGWASRGPAWRATVRSGEGNYACTCNGVLAVAAAPDGTALQHAGRAAAGVAGATLHRCVPIHLLHATRSKVGWVFTGLS